MSEEAEESPYNMHNFEYQKRQVERGKQLNQLIDCVDIFIMTVLKHLIHVFLALGCVGFLVVVSMIMYDKSSPSIDPYEY